MDMKKLAARIHKYRGRYPDIVKETGMKYSTLRKLAGAHLPNATDATIKPVVDWMRKNKP